MSVLVHDAFWYGVLVGFLGAVVGVIVLVALIHYRIKESERDLENGQDR